MKTAIIAAWRKGETDLDATIQSAIASAGEGARVYAVEDVATQGPGRTRDRGIMAALADGCDVGVIIDPHMRFRGDALAAVAAHARATGRLCCPRCWHNDACSWDAPGRYDGGRIVWKIDDPKMAPKRSALLFKWAATQRAPGPIGCVGGACYGFPLEWYDRVGRPLAALPGWGGDEEALSISAWLSDAGPDLIEADVAHRYRAAAPWQLTDAESKAIRESRRVLIQAVVADKADRLDALRWIGSEPHRMTAAGERWRAALLEQPRTWEQWRQEVCEGYATPVPPVRSAETPRGAMICRHGHCGGALIERRRVGKWLHLQCQRCGRRQIEVGNDL